MAKGNFFAGIKDKLSGKKQLIDHKNDQVKYQFSNTKEKPEDHSGTAKNRVQAGQGAVGNGKQDFVDQNDPDVQVGHPGFNKTAQGDHDDPEVKIKLNALRKLRGRRAEDDQMHPER